MKTHYSLVLLAAFFLLLFASCSNLRIEKRHYRGGFYVNYNNKETAGTTATAGETETEDATALPQPATEVESEEKTPSTAHDPVSITEASPKQDVEEVAQSPQDEEAMQSVQQAQNNAAEVSTDNTQQNTADAHRDDADLMLVLLVILAIFLPPLAVFLKEGVTTTFWIDLILAILGSGFFYRGYFAGFFLAAIVIALLVVFDVL